MRSLTLLTISISLLCPAALADGGFHAEVSTTEALMRAARELADGGKGTIELLPGTYELDAPLKFERKGHIVIAGSGWNTTLVARKSTAIEFVDCGFCEVRDLLIDGGMPPEGKSSGIVFRGRSNSNRVSHCRIMRFPASGIRFEGVAEAPMSSNTVRESHLISNRGVQLFSLYNNDFYIVENQFGTHEGHPDAGAVLDHSSAGSYTLNYHWDNRNALRLGPGANFNRIENNRFEESRETGVVIGKPGEDGCYFNIISGNTFHTNSKGERGGFDTITAHNASDITFSGNQIFSWDSGTLRHRNGLTLDHQCRAWVITGNILRHHDGKAIDCANPKEHIMEDNICDPDGDSDSR